MKRGGPLRRLTPLRRGAPLRSRARSLASTVRAEIARRSGGRCEARFTPGCRGVAEHAHHVLRRSQGGKDEPGNLAHVCAPCHHAIHAEPERAYAAGLLRRRTTDPLR